MRNFISALFVFLLTLAFVLILDSPKETFAATVCEIEGGKCVLSNYICSGGTSSPLSCNSGYKCYFGGSCYAPTPTPLPGCSGICLPNGEEDSCSVEGSGTCSSYKFCCEKVKEEPTPTPNSQPGGECAFLYDGKCVTNTLKCIPDTDYQSDCATDKKCVPATAICNNIIPTQPPLDTTTACGAEGGRCYPKDYICSGGTGSSLTCHTGEKCYFGGSCSGTPTGYCPLSNTYTWCTQTNPVWAKDDFPICTETSSNDYYKRACGYASTTSVLCNEIDPKFCDLRYTMNYFPLYRNYATCAGSSLFTHKKVLESFADKIDIVDVSSVRPVPWKKIDENLKFGPVLVSGLFRIPGKTGWITHISLIVGKDANGYIFHDPYFNVDNPNPEMKVNTPYLLNAGLEINLDGAISIRNF